MNKQLRKILAGALVVATAATVVAVTTASGSHPTETAAVLRRPVSPRLYHLVGALKRAHRASALAHPLPAAIAEGTRQDIGIESAAAVYAGGTYPAWIVPGSNEICVFDEAVDSTGDAGGVCGTIAAFEQRGLASGTEGASGNPVIVGLVPGGNRSVLVHDAGGTTSSAPVVDNVYELTSGTPVSVTLVDADGQTITRRVPSISPAPQSPPAAG